MATPATTEEQMMLQLPVVMTQTMDDDDLADELDYMNDQGDREMMEPYIQQSGTDLHFDMDDGIMEGADQEVGRAIDDDEDHMGGLGGYPPLAEDNDDFIRVPLEMAELGATSNEVSIHAGTNFGDFNADFDEKTAEYEVTPQMRAHVEQQTLDFDVDATSSEIDVAALHAPLQPTVLHMAPNANSRKRMAPPTSYSHHSDDSDQETAPATSPPASPASPTSPSSPSTPEPCLGWAKASSQAAAGQGRSATEAQLTTNQTIAMYNLICTNLAITTRKERNFADLFRLMNGRYPWAKDKFPEPSLFKQKIKLFVQERRTRENQKCWKLFKKCGGNVAQTLELLDTKMKTCAAFPADWDLSPVATFLADRVTSKERSPGNIVDWEQPARKCMTDALVAIHLREGAGAFTLAHAATGGLVTLSEVEMAIVSSCSCETCQAWGVNSDLPAHEIIGAWTKARMGIMRDLLNAHVDAGENGTWKTFLNRSQEIPALRNWTLDRLTNFLEGAHHSPTCEYCSAAQRRNMRRRRRAGSDDDSDSDSEDEEIDGADFVPMPTFAELEALERAEDDVPLHLRFDDEVDVSKVPHIHSISSITAAVAKVTI